MIKNSQHLFILTISILFLSILVPIVCGQTKSLTKEEFKMEIDKALQTVETTFPRRETESNPNQIEVFMEGKTDSVSTILDEKIIKEFLAKDKIRYEYKRKTAKGTTSTKRIELGLYCYDESQRLKWVKSEISCDQQSLSVSMPPAKREFFVENGLLDAKPVKIFRAVETSRVYLKGASPYINEYLYYLNSSGLIVKREFLSRKGDEKPKLESFTIYEYKVNIKPIVIPDTIKERKSR